jgi:type I restriction enzyme M protein
VECEPHRRLKLWIYDLRTNKHFTLKENPLKRSDLDDFVACYNPKNSDKSRAGRHERKESERFKSFAYEELTKRDKLNLDIFGSETKASKTAPIFPIPTSLPPKSSKTSKPPSPSSPRSQPI